MYKMFIQIEDRLYQGGLPFDGHSWGPIAENPKDWAVISLEPAVYGSENPDLHFLHLKAPIVDGPFPGIFWLDMMVKCIEMFMETGLKVYVHCYAGWSRSVMLCAAYLMKKYACSMDTALNNIAALNPKLDPNPSFRAGLREWSKYLKESNIDGY